MLKRKYLVQKSFRIDATLEIDLGKLSEHLGRSQNDLVNYALELLMLDNKEWISDNVLVDYFDTYFEGGLPENIYEDDRIFVSINVDEEGNAILFYKIKDDNYEYEKEYTRIFEDDDKGDFELKEILRSLSKLIFKDDLEKEKYLESRLDYR